jgi:hypothetical protein
MTTVDWIEIVRRFGIPLATYLLLRWARPRIPHQATQLLWAAVIAHLGAAVIATVWDVFDQTMFLRRLGLDTQIRFGLGFSSLASMLYVAGLVGALYATVVALRYRATVVRPTPALGPALAQRPTADLFTTHIRTADSTRIAPRPLPDATHLVVQQAPDATRLNPQPPYPATLPWPPPEPLEATHLSPRLHPPTTPAMPPYPQQSPYPQQPPYPQEAPYAHQAPYPQQPYPQQAPPPGWIERR